MFQKFNTSSRFILCVMLFNISWISSSKVFGEPRIPLKPPTVYQTATSASELSHDIRSRPGGEYFRIYRKAYYRHSSVSDRFDRMVTPEYDLGYFANGIGYYDGGHGMFVHPDLLRNRFFAEFTSMLPFYLAYRVQTITADELKIVRPRSVDNLVPLTSQEFRLVSNHFKLALSRDNVQVGDLILASGLPPLSNLSYFENGVRTDCLLHRQSLLQVSAVDGHSNRVHVNLALLWNSAEDTPAANGLYCKYPKTYEVEVDQLANFNRLAVSYAVQKNNLNRKQVREIVGPKEYLQIPIDAELTFCSGPMFRETAIWLDALHKEFPTTVVSFVETDGSTNNSSLVKKGLCSFALIQKDVLSWFQKEYQDSNAVREIEAGVDLAKAYLICDKNDKVTDSSQLTGANTLLVGSRGSGTTIVFETLAAKQINLQKVRHEYLAGPEAMAKVLRDSSAPDAATCSLQVTTDVTAIEKLLRSNARLTLAKVELRGSSYTPSFVTDPRDGKKFSTLEIPVSAIANVTWLGQDPTRLERLKKVVEEVKRARNAR